MHRAACLAVALAGLTLTGFATAAPTTPRAVVSFPPGWRVLPAHDGLVSARHPRDHARCNTDVVRVASMDAATQDALNAELDKPWGAAEWAAFLGAPAGKVELVSTEVRPAGPWRFRTATLLIRKGATRVTREDVYGRVRLQLVPGRILIAACYAPVRHWPAERAGMEATVGSLRGE